MASVKLREFEPLTRILQILPSKVHKAVYTYDASWTCLDVNEDYLAVGTNVGLVFLVERSTEKLQKLSCKSKDVIISKIKMCHSVDHMVAVGTSCGKILIFQLPSILPGRNKQLCMYEVLDMHCSKISSIIWSQNSQKLFSGDEDGLVNCTEFEYDDANVKCKSFFVLKEPNEIVQLDYSYKLLLVSTRWRTIVYSSQEKSIVQVGKRDRKSLGQFGGVFLPRNVSTHPQDMVLFAARPSYRVWKAQSDGTVQSTCMFKDLIKKSTEGLNLLEDTIDINDIGPNRPEDCQFGPLFIFQHTYLVTFHRSGLFVLDPGLGSFIGYHTNIGPVVDVAVFQNEIFILRNGVGRRLVRIAETPYSSPTSTLFRNETFLSTKPEDTTSGTSSAAVKFVGAFKEVSEKLQGVIDGQMVTTKHEHEQPPWGYAKGIPLLDMETPTENAAEKQPHFLDYVTEESECSRNERQQRDQEFSGSGVFREIAPGGPTWEEPLEVNHPGAPPLVLDSRPLDQSQSQWNVPPADNNDIVFSKQKHKKKGKKKAKDKDSTSIASNEVEIPQNTEGASTCTPSQTSTQPVESKTDDIPADGESKSYQPFSEITSRGNTSDTCKITADFSEIDLDKKKSEKTPEEVEKLRAKLECELTALPEVAIDSDIPSTSVLDILEKNQIVKDGDTFEDIVDMGFVMEAPDQIEADDDIDDLPEDLEQNVLENEETVIVKDQEVESESNSDLKPTVESKTASKFSVRVERTISAEQLKTKDDQSNTEHSGSQQGESVESMEDDFYSLYGNYSGTSKARSKSSRPEADQSIDDVLDLSASVTTEKCSSEKVSAGAETGKQGTKMGEHFDFWTEFLAPGNLQCVCVTKHHVWVVDKSEKMHWSFLSGPGVKWHTLEKTSAQQISVSPSGGIVWRVHNGTLYVGTKITTRAPAGLKWVDFVQKDVVNISVDDNMGWYVKANGEVVMHKKLSRERPCFKPVKVACSEQIVQVSCRKGVVWGVTIDRLIVVRTGIAEDVEEGTDWTYLDGSAASLLVSSCDLGVDDTAWVLDVVGRVWFTTGVTASQPTGSGQWWQLNYRLHNYPGHQDGQEVSLAEYLMQESTAFSTIKSIASNPKKLVKMMKQEEKGGIIAARCNGVWICPAYKNNLHVCTGSMIGHRWQQVDLPGMVSSINKWLHLSVGGIEGNSGLIWAQQPSGDLFCFNPNKTQNANIKVMEVAPPEAGSGKAFKCLSVLSSVVWALMPSGNVYLRTDIRQSCPQGINWVNLNIQQLGSVKILWLSAGSQNVWALDSTGQIYLRIGVDPPSKQLLNPAWVPVEGTPHTLGARFTKVFAGPNEWMVWALDSSGNIYVRKGITDSMPIGTHWVFVNGPKTEHLCVGKQYVYGLTHLNEIIVREGIHVKNLKGDYWSMIPGTLCSMSVTSEKDNLWGINKDGQLCQRFVYSLNRSNALEALCGTPLGALRGQDVEGGWELL